MQTGSIRYIISALLVPCIAPRTGDMQLPGIANQAVCCKCQLTLTESFPILLSHVMRHTQEMCCYLVHPTKLCDASVDSHQLNQFYFCCVMHGATNRRRAATWYTHLRFRCQCQLTLTESPLNLLSRSWCVMHCATNRRHAATWYSHPRCFMPVSAYIS